MVFHRFVSLVVCLAFALGSNAQTFTNEHFRLQVPPAPDMLIANVSLADYNGDGRLDMYHAGRLYRQEEDGTFANVLSRANITVEGNAVQGAVFGDANLDGRLDLLIYDSFPGSRFYLNRSGEKFDLASSTTNILFQSGIGGAFWGDINHDGWLDLVVKSDNGNHPVFAGSESNSYTNIAALVLSQTSSPTCGLASADYDRDGDPDFFSANCGAGNNLMENQSNRNRFWPLERLRGVESNRISTTAVWFDYDNDGWEDLLVVNQKDDFISSLNHLYHNNQGTGFTDVAVQAGIAGIHPLNNGPAAVADFDNDGWQDLYLPINNRGRFYHNNGDGTFDERWSSTISLPGELPDVVATGDLNNDGWIDLVIPHQLGTAIMMNDGGDNNWITFELRDDQQNRFGVGATIRVTTGATEQMRVISAGTGAGSQSDFLKAHFGLGEATGVDQVIVEWPDGQIESFIKLDVNKNHTIVKSVGVNAPPQSFNPISPPDAGFVETDQEFLRFEWEISVDIDPVTYTLNMTGPGVRLSFPNLSDPFYELDTAILPANHIYEWSVSASDGHTIRGGSSVRLFSFGQPDVASSTLQQPVLYDFGIPDLSSGVAEFQDYDRDGDLDLLIGGDSESGTVLQIYRADDATVVIANDGGQFIFKSLNLSDIALDPVSQAAAAWGDFNQDGNPDLVVTGLSTASGEPLITFYLNTVGTFIPITVEGVPAAWGGNIRWGDVDGDGDLDLLVAGARNAEPPFEPATEIYLNMSGNVFVASNSGLPGIVFGDVTWGDIDGDGDLDVALTGDLGGGNFHSGIYRNDGGSFSMINSPLPELVGGTVSFGDFDNDSDLDLLISGGGLGPGLLHGFTGLYVNNSSSFFPHPFPFDGVVTGSAIWGDYENDGDLDIFVVGARTPHGDPLGRLYRNVGGQFAAELDVKGFLHATAAFGDYNQDGDLDLITFGIDADGNHSLTFYINQQIPEPVPVTR